ncbi:ankyrin repeat domain-containing protein [bacterium]|nr:ankyrin repeat domain-containing protein [bacterium]NBW56844.1 ankyrin repeat domain-containing protein [bacterium]NBX72644.1 ankyrin repeat domain-containing protein [bacterium]
MSFLTTDKKTFKYLDKALKRKDDRSACVFLHRFSAIDLSNPNIDFKSLLFRVAAYGKPSTLDLLMERSSRSEGFNRNDDVHRQDEQGKTALHHAIETGNVEMIEALVKDHRADVKVKDKNGETPITLAERLSQGDVADFLRNSTENRQSSLFLNTTRSMQHINNRSNKRS